MLSHIVIFVGLNISSALSGPGAKLILGTVFLLFLGFCVKLITDLKPKW